MLKTNLQIPLRTIRFVKLSVNNAQKALRSLRAGHLSLVDTSMAECDRTVVTIFVNPTQFGPGEDYALYLDPTWGYGADGPESHVIGLWCTATGSGFTDCTFIVLVISAASFCKPHDTNALVPGFIPLVNISHQRHLFRIGGLQPGIYPAAFGFGRCHVVTSFPGIDYGLEW